MNVFAYIGIILCLAVSTHTRSVKETEGATAVEGRISLQTTFAKAEGNPVVDADFCTPNPCKNGGNCSKSLKKCWCNSGYSGVYCEKCTCDKGVCKENEKGIFVCTCPEEWGVYGAGKCQKCECGKGANCTFDVGIFSASKVCLCKVGYEDAKGVCKGTCKTNPCKNNGKCVVKGNKIQCDCRGAFSGEFCEKEEILFSSTITPEVTANIASIDSSSVVSGGSTRNLLTTFPPRSSAVDKLNKTTSWIHFNVTTIFPRNVSTTERFSRGHSLNFTRERGSTVQLITATASTSIDLCAVNPCKNGGICRIEDNVARCYCISPFTGKLCEKEIPFYSTTTPKGTENITSVGNSNMVSGGPTRNLLTTFPPKPSTVDELNKTASRIDLNVTTVFPRNVSTPVSITERFSRGYSLNFTRERGSTVQLITTTASTARDLCAINPCKNGGICRMEGNMARCYCISPFTGKLCEKDPCFLNPCMNGGQCKVNETSFQCKCGFPYSGRLCEKDPCSENPCQNGGKCFVTGNSFKCFCKAPYAGILCETDPCAWNPCKNGGICKIEIGAIKCFCKAPFTGEFCDARKNFDTYVISLAAASGILVIVVILLSCLLCQSYPVVKTN